MKFEQNFQTYPQSCHYFIWCPFTIWFFSSWITSYSCSWCLQSMHSDLHIRSLLEGERFSIMWPFIGCCYVLRCLTYHACMPSLLCVWCTCAFVLTWFSLWSLVLMVVFVALSLLACMFFYCSRAICALCLFYFCVKNITRTDCVNLHKIFRGYLRMRRFVRNHFISHKPPFTQTSTLLKTLLQIIWIIISPSFSC